MGKDRSKDRDAATSSADNKDHSQDQESRDAVLARTITIAVAGALAQQKSEETQSIAEAVAGALAKQKAEETQSITEAFTRQMENTQSITEAFTRQMEKAHAQYEKLFKKSCAATLPTTLKVTSSSDGFRVMDPFDWTMDKDVYQRWQLWSHKARHALDEWRETQRRLRSPTCITGSMGQVLPKLKDGKTARSSSARPIMML